MGWRERLKQGGPMPPTEALDIVKKIAGALDYAHKWQKQVTDTRLVQALG